MKLFEIVKKYKYALIALALVAVIAGASVLYNSLSDDYRGDGFAELPSTGADNGSADSGSHGTGGKPSGESNPDTDSGDGSAPENDGTEDGNEDGTPSVEDESGTESDGSDGSGADGNGADGNGTSPETGDDHDHGADDGPDHNNEGNFPTVRTYDFEAIDKDGNTVKLSDFVGKPIVLNFWATWCPYCVVEMPAFDKASKELSDVTFLMLNATSSEGESLAKAKSFIQQNGYEFPVLYDTRGEATRAFGISSYPMTFFIDSDGVVRLYAEGRISYDTIISALERLKDFE
jgi:peroxiredoxin